MRVLLVEDEALLAIDIAEILTDAGFEVIGPATSVAKALKLLEEEGCDVAVLDINLRDETAEPIAWKLRDRQISFLFLSAVSQENLPDGLNNEVLLRKPVRPGVLVTTLQSFLAKA